MPKALGNPVHAYIYVMGEKDGPVKIGYSSSPSRRLEDLRKATRMDLQLLWCGEILLKNARGVELLTHKLLAEHRVEGEWFAVTLKQAEAAILEADRQYDARPKVLVPKVRGQAVTAHLEGDLAERFNAWRARQSGLPPRAACVRSLLEIALAVEEKLARDEAGRQKPTKPEPTP